MGTKSKKRQWRHSLPTLHHLPFFLTFSLFFLPSFSRSKFYVNAMIGSGVITTFVYKGLTGNSEIGNTPAYVLPISGDWDESGILSLARMSLIKCYWMLQNARVLAFTVFDLLRENQQLSKITPPTTQIRVNNTFVRLRNFPNLNMALKIWWCNNFTLR